MSTLKHMAEWQTNSLHSAVFESIAPYREVCDLETCEFCENDRIKHAHLIAAAPLLVEALELAEKADWAERNFLALDILHPGRLGAKLEAEKYGHLASMARKAALAAAKGEVTALNQGKEKE